MISFKNYKNLTEEEEKAALIAAGVEEVEGFLQNKYGERFTYAHIQDLEDSDKTLSIVTKKGNQFKVHLKKFESEDGSTLLGFSIDTPTIDKDNDDL